MSSYKQTITLALLATITSCTSAMETDQPSRETHYGVITKTDNQLAPITWAHATLSTLTRKEKVGQLFMIAAISDIAQNPGFLEHTPYIMDKDYVKQLITDYHVGGVIFLGLSTAQKQYELTQQFQQISTIPLLIGQDLEWGLHMRLRDTIQFPYALTLGALQDNELLYQLGKEIGKQCQSIGVHINFAPVVDINTNPNNPVINHRSFGDNPGNVSQKSAAFARGLQDAGIIACAKHFPGHGDTDVDSHYDLPLIRHNIDRLHNIELTPFKYLIAENIPAIMTAHIAVPSLRSCELRQAGPALEKHTNVPASLSYSVVTELLKNELGFTGLVITDGLGMRGVTKNYEPGYVELNALLAGNDILLCPVDVPCAVDLIMHAIENEQFSEDELDARVLKILSAKELVFMQRNKGPFALSLSKGRPHSYFDELSTNGEYNHDNLHTKHAYDLKRTLYNNTITVVRDSFSCLPLDTTKPITLLQIGCANIQSFAQEVCTALPNNTSIHSYNPTDTDQCSTNLIAQLPTEIPIIIALHGMNRVARENYGITQTIQNTIKQIHAHNANTLLVVFGNPYSCALFEYLPGLVCAYQDDVDAQVAAAEILLGKLEAQGKLPVSIT